MREREKRQWRRQRKIRWKKRYPCKKYVCVYYKTKTITYPSIIGEHQSKYGNAFIIIATSNRPTDVAWYYRNYKKKGCLKIFYKKIFNAIFAPRSEYFKTKQRTENLKTIGHMWEIGRKLTLETNIQFIYHIFFSTICPKFWGRRPID